MTEDQSADIAKALTLMNEALVILDELNLHACAIYVAQAIDMVTSKPLEDTQQTSSIE